MLCYLDASAWSKRYTGEPGWESVDALLDEVAAAGQARLLASAITHAETLSALVRFRNRTALPDEEFDRVLGRLMADRDRLFWLSVPENAFRGCTSLILKHNLNATDAALLWVLLDFRAVVQAGNGQLWLIACDKRLLRAASLEGLPCLDPEISSRREVRQLLAGR